MSEQVGFLQETGSRKVDMSIVRFYGGERVGMCLQLTALMEDMRDGYIQISAEDAIALLPALKMLIDKELSRRLKITKQAIAENEDLKKTILQDMVEVSEMAISQPVLRVASLLSLGGKEISSQREES